MNTHDENRGYEILQTFHSDKGELISYREIKSKTRYSNDAIRYWLRYLKNKHLIGQVESVNHKDRKYYLTSLAKMKNKQEILEMLIDVRRKKKIQKTGVDVTAKKSKRRPSKLEKKALREEKVEFLFLYHAALGVTFETVLPGDREFYNKAITLTPSTDWTEILRRQTIAASPYTPVDNILLDSIKGVAIKDFFSKYTLDLTIYSHLHELGFERQEIKECIKKLISKGILQHIYDAKRHEKRYQIVNPLLKKFIWDLSTLLQYLREKIRFEWHSFENTL